MPLAYDLKRSSGEMVTGQTKNKRPRGKTSQRSTSPSFPTAAPGGASSSSSSSSSSSAQSGGAGGTRGAADMVAAERLVLLHMGVEFKTPEALLKKPEAGGGAGGGGSGGGGGGGGGGRGLSGTLRTIAEYGFDLLAENPVWHRDRFITVLERALETKEAGPGGTFRDGYFPAPRMSEDGWPIWPAASTARTVVERLVPFLGYVFTQGPWRRMLIRRGYDPRGDPSARVYQVIDFRYTAPGQKRPGRKTTAGVAGGAGDGTGEGADSGTGEQQAPAATTTTATTTTTTTTSSSSSGGSGGGAASGEAGGAGGAGAAILRGRTLPRRVGRDLRDDSGGGGGGGADREGGGRSAGGGGGGGGSGGGGVSGMCVLALFERSAREVA